MNSTITRFKSYSLLAWVLAIGINGLIVLSFFWPKTATVRFSFLPLVNAVLNGLTFLSLLAALAAIRRKDIGRHRRLVVLAFSFTSLFLVSYLLYHFTTPSTKYGGPALQRYIYLFILVTHIILAVIIVPLALVTMGRGLKMDVTRHRKIARWTMPIWLYVSLTGVIVYLMISPYYK